MTVKSSRPTPTPPSLDNYSVPIDLGQKLVSWSWDTVDELIALRPHNFRFTPEELANPFYRLSGLRGHKPGSCQACEEAHTDMARVVVGRVEYELCPFCRNRVNKEWSLNPLEVAR